MSIKRQRIRLTESDLCNMVKESVCTILAESEGYVDVDNLQRYIQDHNLPLAKVSKFQRVNMKSGKKYIEKWGKEHGLDRRQIGNLIRRKGAPLTTIASDGSNETTNTVTRNHVVLNNVGNTDNQWAAEKPTFNRKYVQDHDRTYRPTGGPMMAAQVDEPIEFTAPWGERMRVDKGGYILQDPNNPKDSYGISKKDFDSTYRFD